jgi:hypothetical protein
VAQQFLVQDPVRVFGADVNVHHVAGEESVSWWLGVLHAIVE